MTNSDSLIASVKPSGALGRLIDRVRDEVNYAFQPVVNIHSGVVYGYEALLRGVERLGFRNVRQLLDLAHQRGLLYHLEITLRELAIARFAELPERGAARLLFNLDPLVLEIEWHLPGRTTAILARHDLHPSTLCFELTEMRDASAQPAAQEAIARLRQRRHLLAIDDFGTGYAGLKLLYEFPPDLIKIDRFFISRIALEHRKRLFVEHTVELAHTLGVQVVAEGIETRDELIACRDIGCDLAQGFFIERPQIDPGVLRGRYSVVGEIAAWRRRHEDVDADMVRERIESIPVLRESDNLHHVFDCFKQHSECSFFPVLDHLDRPLGLLREASLKARIYSKYGRDLLSNPSYRKSLRDFMSPCPTAEVSSSAERLLEIYASADRPPGIIMTDGFRYLGFLSEGALLRLIDQKNLAVARDQNPLTRLPGNNSIVAFVSQALDEPSCGWCFAYLDFDHFKPFNDTCGFRQGDRAISLFADLLRKQMPTAGGFAGHIGGDDFFVALQLGPEPLDPDRLAATAGPSCPAGVAHFFRMLLRQFALEAESLYDADARRKGFIEATNREGTARRYPLLTCSAALLLAPPNPRTITLDTLSSAAAVLKKEAKAEPGGIAVRALPCRD